jgi:hypothetical protein
LGFSTTAPPPKSAEVLDVIDEAPGTAEFIEWFGYWPSFHDAEVLDLRLCRSGPSTIRVHTFETTDLVNSDGFFVCIKHVVVSFVFDQVANLNLNYFNAQNVINELHLRQISDGYQLTLEPCHGIEGTITGDRIRVTFAPGIPEDGQYANLAAA